MHCPNLVILSVQNNKIGKIEDMSGLPNLKEVYLDGNKLEDISALSCLSKLTSIDVSDNQLATLSPLIGLEDLTDLWFSKNPQIDVIRELSSFHSLQSIQTISFEGCISPSPMTCQKIICKSCPNINKINGNCI